MAKLTEWQLEILTALRAYSNDELISKAFELAGGDDYDGCFTDRGQWEYYALSYELDYRLWDSGWSKRAPAAPADLPCARCGGSWDEHGGVFGGANPVRDCPGYTDDGEHGEE